MATISAERIFLDTNVLVYASVREAPGHAAARGFGEDCLARGITLVISRQVLREYLAVLSKPQTYAVTIPRETLLAWVHAWCDRCEVLDDTAAVTETLLRLFTEVPFGGKQVHDANVAATLLVHGLDTLGTTNGADFIRFGARLKLIDPLSA